MDTLPRSDPHEKRIAVVVVHGVGDTEVGWINDYIVAPMSGPHRNMTVVTHSELYQLPEKGRSGAEVAFPVLVRRAVSGTNRISFVEMFWADLSRIPKGAVAYAAATLKLMFEAPDVLARALLHNRWRGLHGLIALLVLISGRLLSWFVVGLNIVVIACAGFMTAVWYLYSNDFLPSGLLYDDSTVAFWLSPVVVALIVAGNVLYWRHRRRDIGWAEFGRGLALSGIAVLIYIAVATALSHGVLKLPSAVSIWLSKFETGWNRLGDFEKGRIAVFFVWIAWCTTTLLTIALLLLVSAARAFGWRARQPVPIVATWVAIFNILIQAIVLKLIIAPASILSCTQLRTAYKAARPDVKIESLCDEKIPSGVFFFTLIETVLIIATLLVLFFLRRAAAKRGQTDQVPRLIIHPWLIAAAALTVTLHIAVFAELMMNWNRPSGSYVNLLQMPAGRVGYDRLPHAWLAFLVWLVPTYIAALRALHGASVPLVHIVRELVDHQYREGASLLGLVGLFRSRDTAATRNTRRQPIAARLDTIMERLLAGERFDKLIFLAHSQGSVIAFDYLRSREDNDKIGSIGEIHVVTMGSPLTHLYAHYFDEYARPVSRSDLRGNVVSWVNFTRIDDPIGADVGVVEGDFIDNRRLGRGGHVDYWRQTEVREHVAKLLEMPTAAVSPVATR